MALTFSDKSDIRRHLKYPLAGSLRDSASGMSVAMGSAGYRFFQAYGFLEYRMNNLMPDEEARTLGQAYGAVGFYGPGGNVGDTVTLTISGGGLTTPVVLTITLTQTILTNLQVSAAVAQAAAQNIILQASNFRVDAPYGAGPYSQNAVDIPQVAIVNYVTPFTLTLSTTGAIAAQILTNGSFLSPNMIMDSQTVYGYLPILNYLEGTWSGSNQNFDTSKAAVWTWNARESRDRKMLYEQWVLHFSRFIDIPVNTNRQQSVAPQGRESVV